MNLRLTLLCLAGLVVLVGCDKQAVTTERVPKTTKVAPPQDPAAAKDPHAGMAMPNDPHAGMAMPGSAPMASAASPRIATFDAPANWEAQPPAAMREASFVVKGEGGTMADVSLIILRGAAGDALKNVNRWLSQVGQPAISAERLAEIAQRITTPLGEVLVVELEGVSEGADATKDGKILAAIAVPEGDTWFFKIRGNVALVAAEKEHFLEWVRSTKSSASSEASSAGSADSCPAHGKAESSPSAAAGASCPAPGMSPAVPVEASVAADEPPSETSGEKPLQWEVPEGWTSAPASGMRHATFVVGNATGQKADMSVSFLAGDGGGDLGNVNRWRQQVGLAPVAAGELDPTVVRFDGMSVVDLGGADQRMLAGWIQHGGRTWFFKLMGPTDLVGGEKEKFMGFLKSVKFKN